MRSVQVLFKLQQRKLDELLLQRKDKQSEMELNHVQLEILEGNFNLELKKFNNNDLLSYLARYIQVTQNSRKSILGKINSVKQTILRLENEIIEVHAEMKKYKIVLEQYEKKKLKKEAEVQLRLFNEFNISRYTQKNP